MGTTTFNRYYNFRKLPEVLTFFNGKRFVPFVVIYRSVLVAIILSLFWPLVQTGINHFGQWIANSQNSAPILAPFIYGTLGASITSIWFTPYVDYPNELHFIRWYL